MLQSVRTRVEWTVSVLLMASAVKVLTVASRLKLLVAG